MRLYKRRPNSFEPLEHRLLLSSATGLRADFYNATAAVFNANSPAVTQAPALTQTDSTVDFNWNGAAPASGVNAQNFAVRFSGQVLTEQAGNYVFHVTTDAAVRLYVNGQLVVNDYTQHTTSDGASVALNLKANTLYNIQLDIAEGATSSDSVSLQWVLPSGTRQIIPAAQLYPYSQALTIKSGGIYVGSWENTAPKSTAVTVATSQPVTIEDSIIRGAGLLIHNTVSGAQLTILNNSAYGLNPNVAGVSKADFLYALDPASVDVEHNYIDNVGGYGIDIHGFVGSGSQTVKILYNQIENLDGRYSDGNGGYESSGDPTPHDIILSNIKSVAGMEIAWNQIVNQPGQSYVNDVVNIYDSSGTSSSPIKIHDNYIQGLYSINPDTQYDSGCGIITDGDDGADETAYVQIYDNEIVATGNAAISVAAGHDISVYGNRAICSGILPDGNTFYSSYNGISIDDLMNGGSSSTFYNNVAYDNAVAWMQPPHSVGNGDNTTRNDNYFLADGSASASYGNTSLGVATQAMEAAESTDWQVKLVSNNVTVGPVTLAPQTVTVTPTPPAPTPTLPAPTTPAPTPPAPTPPTPTLPTPTTPSPTPPAPSPAPLAPTTSTSSTSSTSSSSSTSSDSTEHHKYAGASTSSSVSSVDGDFASDGPWRRWSHRPRRRGSAR
jgi:PA14 domain